jgi:hypothetical protein
MAVMLQLRCDDWMSRENENVHESIPIAASHAFAKASLR